MIGKINIENYFEKTMNDYPMKIINTDKDLTPTGNNIFEKYDSKRMSKK